MANINVDDFKKILRNARQYDIPSPASDGSDNGKVLKIVDGKAKWVMP